MKKLPKIAKRYLADRVVCPIYASNLNRVAERCGVIGTEAVNEYLRARLGQVSTITARTERTIIVSLWRYAYEQSLTDKPPRGVMLVKTARAPTAAWTPEQCKMLVEGTNELAGTLRSGAPLGLFLRTWIILGYQSGSRRGDLWAMRAENFDGGTLRWTQHKTGDPLHKRLTPACVEAVRQMLALSPDGRVLGWACRMRQSMRIMKSYLESKGLPGTSKWLRRSGATHIEIREPGKARLHLGHRSVNLASQCYIDWSQVRHHAPETPSLVD
jgi:integrase